MYKILVALFHPCAIASPSHLSLSPSSSARPVPASPSFCSLAATRRLLFFFSTAAAVECILNALHVSKPSVIYASSFIQ